MTIIGNRLTGVRHGALAQRHMSAVMELQDPTLPAAPAVLFIFSGPSGVGKDTIVEKLRKNNPANHYAITCTSRSPRPGEVDGVDYHFRTDAQFERLIASGELLEFATVYGHYYGTPRWEITEPLQRHQDVVIKLDVQGVASIKAEIPDAVSIFIAPSSYTELTHRMARRHTETGNERDVRLETAHIEMRSLETFDYVILNREGELAQTVEVAESILTAEKARVKGRSWHVAQ